MKQIVIFALALFLLVAEARLAQACIGGGGYWKLGVIQGVVSEITPGSLTLRKAVFMKSVFDSVTGESEVPVPLVDGTVHVNVWTTLTDKRQNTKLEKLVKGKKMAAEFEDFAVGTRVEFPVEDEEPLMPDWVPTTCWAHKLLCVEHSNQKQRKQMKVIMVDHNCDSNQVH